MQEFERDMARERENKLAQLSGLEERRMKEYKSVIERLNKDKLCWESQRNRLQCRIVDSNQSLHKAQVDHGYEMQRMRVRQGELEIQTQIVLTEKGKKEEQVISLIKEIDRLSRQVQKQAQDMLRVQEAHASQVKNSQQQIDVHTKQIQEQKEVHQQLVREMVRQHKDEMKVLQRSIRLDLDNKLQEMDKHKRSQQSQREFRIKALETQNMKLVHQINSKLSAISTLKQQNLQLQEDLSSQRLKSKLKVKERDFQVENLKKQLAFQKDQTKSQNSKYNLLIEERHQSKIDLEDIKKKYKEQLKESKQVMQAKIKEYIGYNQQLVKDLAEELRGTKAQKMQLVESLRNREMSHQKNLLKAQIECNTLGEGFEKESRESAKRQSQLKSLLDIRTQQKSRLEEQIQKQKLKIVKAMKVFDDLIKSKIDVEKENKLMVSQIKYWRDKYREVEKGRLQKPDIPTPIRQERPVPDNLNKSQKDREPKSQISKPVSQAQQPQIYHNIILSDKSQQLCESDQLQDVLQSLRYNDQANNSKVKSRLRKSQASSHPLKGRVEQSAFSFPHSSQFQSMYRFVQN